MSKPSRLYLACCIDRAKGWSPLYTRKRGNVWTTRILKEMTVTKPFPPSLKVALPLETNLASLTLPLEAIARLTTLAAANFTSYYFVGAEVNSVGSVWIRYEADLALYAEYESDCDL